VHFAAHVRTWRVARLYSVQCTVQWNSSVSETFQNGTHVRIQFCLEWPILWPPRILIFLPGTLCVTCIPTARQRLDKHIPMGANARNNRMYIFMQRRCKLALQTRDRLCFLRGPCKATEVTRLLLAYSFTQSLSSNERIFWLRYSGFREKIKRLTNSRMLKHNMIEIIFKNAVSSPENTICLRIYEEPVNVSIEVNRCSLQESYETRKRTVWAIYSSLNVKPRCLYDNQRALKAPLSFRQTVTANTDYLRLSCAPWQFHKLFHLDDQPLHLTPSYRNTKESLKI
jgi:hypothetical protein